MYPSEIISQFIALNYNSHEEGTDSLQSQQYRGARADKIVRIAFDSSDGDIRGAVVRPESSLPLLPKGM